MFDCCVKVVQLSKEADKCSCNPLIRGDRGGVFKTLPRMRFTGGFGCRALTGFSEDSAGKVGQAVMISFHASPPSPQKHPLL